MTRSFVFFDLFSSWRSIALLLLPDMPDMLMLMSSLWKEPEIKMVSTSTQTQTMPTTQTTTVTNPIPAICQPSSVDVLKWTIDAIPLREIWNQFGASSLNGTKCQCTLELTTCISLDVSRGCFSDTSVARLGPDLHCAFFKIFLGATAAQSHGGSTEAGLKSFWGRKPKRHDFTVTNSKKV